MKVSNIRDMVIRTYEAVENGYADYSLLLLGAPGIGKSTQVKKAAEFIAEQRGYELITPTDDIGSGEYFVFTDLRLSTVEPTDLTGHPKTIDGVIKYVPFEWMVLHKEYPGILFLDEITWIQREDVWSITPQIALDKIAGFTKFHENTLVVAAGNRPEDTSISREIHNSLLNRFRIYNVSTPNPHEWAEFMDTEYGDMWDKRILAFLLAYRESNYILKMPEDTEGLEQFPTPRSWTWLARELHLNNGRITKEDIRSFIGSEMAMKLDAFLKADIDIEDLIRNPHKVSELTFDEKYMLPIQLASWISEVKDFRPCLPLIDAMGDLSREYIIITLMTLKPRVRSKLVKTLVNHNPRYRDELSEFLFNVLGSVSN